jgi:uncharacterized protein YaaR (DUF327 family)
MIEMEKTEKDKKSIKIKTKRENRRVSSTLNVVQSRFYDELKIAETEQVHVAFDNLVEEISRQGERFYKNPTFEELKTYKSLVMAFLKHITEHMLSTEHRTGGSRMKQKIYTVTKIIDERLEALSKLIFSQQEKNIELLATLDEIRGLLVDLYK